MSRYQDAIIPVVLMGVAGLFAYEAMNIPAQYFQRAPGIVYYPLMLSAAIFVASLLLLVISLMRLRGASEVENEKELESRPGDEPEAAGPVGEFGEEPVREPAAHTFAARVLPVLLGVAILVIYVLLLAIFGFIVSTLVMLVALLLAYGVRNWRMIAAMSVGTTVIIYLVFNYLLGIQLL